MKPTEDTFGSVGIESIFTHLEIISNGKPIKVLKATFVLKPTEDTFDSVGFEDIFTHLESISNGRPIKMLNDSIDISKSIS